MAERRYTHHNATPSIEYGTEGPRAACDQDWAPFEVLMEKTSGPTFRWAIDEANSLCDSCPIKAGCWDKSADEQWLKQLKEADPERDVPTRDCETCGKAFEIGPRQGQKRFCSDACNKAAWRAAKRVAA